MPSGDPMFSITMLLFLISFVVLLLPSEGNYADSLGLECGSHYNVEKPKLKKTKVWKKCHDSNKELLSCLEQGFGVINVDGLVNRAELLCEYVSSRDHIVRYTDRVEAEKAGLMKKYQKGKEFKGIVEDMKLAFVKVTAANESTSIIDVLRAENEAAIAEVHNSSEANLASVMESMADLSKHFAEKVRQKAMNVFLDYEDLALDLKDAKPPFHMSMQLEDVPPWTSAVWSTSSSSYSRSPTRDRSSSEASTSQPGFRDFSFLDIRDLSLVDSATYMY